MHQLNFSIPLLAHKWRRRTGVRHKSHWKRAIPASHVGKPKRMEFPFSPWASAPFSATPTWLFAAFTYTHVVQEGDNLAQDHLEAQRLPRPVIWTFLPLHSVYEIFNLESGRVHCFENNLNTFRTDFQNGHFFLLHKFYRWGFQQAILKVQTHFWSTQCNTSASCISSYWLYSVLLMEDTQRSQTLESTKLGQWWAGWGLIFL